ncbi:hypothetical protein D3C75_1368740 [compost metagenome]
MAVDDEGMQIECDIDKTYSTGELYQREVVMVGQINHLLRNEAEIRSQLNAQTGGVLIDQALYKRQGRG